MNIITLGTGTRVPLPQSLFWIFLIILSSSWNFIMNAMIIGHRGAPAYATENTISSFQKALALDVWAIECNVMFVVAKAVSLF